MSYYVTGDDEAEDEEPQLIQSRLGPPQQQASAKAPTIQAPPPREARFKHHMPPTYPNTIKAPPPRPPPPQPTVHLIDTIQRSSGPKEPDTVDQMVKKLEALSTALTNFSGVPTVPKSPKQNSESGKFALMHCVCTRTAY